MRRLLLRCLVAVLVLLAGAAAGLYASASVAPERLRVEVERHLADISGGPCQLVALRLDPGLPIELEGRGLVLWGGALRVERIRARLSVFSLLAGAPRFSRLRLDGARLAITGDERGLQLPWEVESGRPDSSELAAGEPVLASLALTDGFVRAMLAGPLLGDTVEVRRSRFVVELPGSSGTRSFSLEGVRGRLAHSRLRGDAELSLQARVVVGERELGALEWEGERDADQSLRMSVAATGLELAWLGDLADRGRPLGTQGRISGVADYRTDAAGEATLDLDWLARDFSFGRSEANEPLLTAPEVSGRIRITLDERNLVVSDARIASGDVGFELDAELARPISESSKLGLAVRFGDIDVARARHLVEQLPVDTVNMNELMSVVDAGRIVSFQARGAAPVRIWRDLFSGYTKSLPRRLQVDVEVADVGLALGRGDRIEEFAGRFAWTGDRVEVRRATGRRGEVQLPELDLDISGVSHIFAARPEDRVFDGREFRLAGLPLLLDAFEQTDAPGTTVPHMDVHFARLEHPAVLWPLRDLEISVEPRPDGLALKVHRATWAGIPMTAAAFVTEEASRILAHLDLGVELARVNPAPRVSRKHMTEDEESEPVSELPVRIWAAGGFSVGPIESPHWRHRDLRGHFHAVGTRIHFDELEATLSRGGRLAGYGDLDLGSPDSLPYRAQFIVEGASAEALFDQAGLGDDLVTGSVDLSGRLEGRHEPGAGPFDHLTGRLDLEARDGEIRRTLPAVLALTMASDSLDVFSKRETIRYETCKTTLEITEGRVHTEGLALDGPDLRLFASGSLELARAPHPIEAELAVFLFRPIDWAIGKIPILNQILLGDTENLVAAYFELVGPWDAPRAEAKPLRTLSQGGIDVMMGVPRVVLRGIEALGGILGGSQDSEDAP